MVNFEKEYKCALVFTHDLIGGKWKLRILWHIIHGDNRFSMLKKAIPDITEKVLYTQLRDLQKSGIIEKEIVNEQPPKTILYHLREEYKDLEKHGLLVRLPCKVGDMVLDNDFGYQELYEIKAFSYGYCDSYVEPDIGTEDEIIFYYENYTGSITGAFPMSEIGKTVFLTHKKAEDKLEELKNEI